MQFLKRVHGSVKSKSLAPRSCHLIPESSSLMGTPNWFACHGTIFRIFIYYLSGARGGCIVLGDAVRHQA